MALLDELRQGRTLVLSHVNADIDAMGCSIALAAMFPGVEVGAVESVSRGAQNLLQHFGGRYPVLTDPPVAANAAPYDRVLFVDTATPAQVGHYAPMLATSIVIDHHAPDAALRAANPRYVCDPDSPSCAQLVHRLAREAGAQVNGDAAFALVAGIVADTERFRIAPNSAVEDALAILRAAGIELSEVIGAMERPVYDRSQVVAVLKAAQRMAHMEAGQFILAHTRVGAFEASAARHMVSMGADVALVVHEEGGTVSITARASRRALDAGFHLGDYMQRLAQVVGGSGGGHAGAAGFKAPGKVEDVEPRAVALAREMLRRLGQDQAQ